MIRKVFVSSFDAFMLNMEHNSINTYRSPVYEMCKVCKKFGLLNMVDSILSGDLPTPSKKKWSDLVWGIDDDYWRSVNTMNKGNDLLASTMEGIRYMVWWQMSDAETSMIKECECIAKILLCLIKA